MAAQAFQLEKKTKQRAAIRESENSATNNRKISAKPARNERQKVTLLRCIVNKINNIIGVKKIIFGGHGSRAPVLCLRVGAVWRRHPVLGQRRAEPDIFLTENRKLKTDILREG